MLTTYADASDLIRAEYGDSRNFMTPRYRRCGWIAQGRIAYETSRGYGFNRQPIYGLSIVHLRANGTRSRARRLSGLFHDPNERRAYIRHLSRRFARKGL